MAHQLTRKTFLQLTVATVGAKLIGCGDDDGPARPDLGGDTDMGSGGTDMGGGGTDMGGGGVDMGGGGGTDMGGGGDTDMGASMCSGAVIVADISNNHDHSLEIPVADIMAGTEKQYVTGGTTTHCHVVTITAADFATLRAGGEVRVVSCNNTEHEYALSCAGSVTANDPAPTCGTSNEGRYTDGCTGDTFTP